MIYWNPYKLLSYNADIYMVVGAKSIGKTYKEKILALKDFFKNGTQFVFSRQTDKQIQIVKNEFLSDLKANNEFNGKVNNLFIKGNRVLYIDEKKKIKVVGFFSSLNVITNTKGFTTTYNLKWYFQDEFISETGEYLKDEVKRFVVAISTFFRLRNDGKVLMTANALSMDNPYFNLFGITMPKSGSFCKRIIKIEDPITKEIYNLVVVCEFIKPSNDFITASTKSLAGKLAILSGYGESSINNKFILDDNSNVVEMKNLKCDLQAQFNLYFNDKMMGIYKNESHNIVFVGKPVNNLKTYVFNDIVKASESNCILSIKRSNVFKILLNYQLNGYMVYDNLQLKNAFIDLLNNVK